MEELKIKLAKWVGFELKKVQCVGMVYYETERDCWYYNGREYGLNLPNFPESLDACFEWLVPKLIRKYPIDAIAMEQGLWSIHLHNTCETEAKTYYDNGSVPTSGDAHSLCLAIEKLIDAGDKE